MILGKRILILSWSPGGCHDFSGQNVFSKFYVELIFSYIAICSLIKRNCFLCRQHNETNMKDDDTRPLAFRLYKLFICYKQLGSSY